VTRRRTVPFPVAVAIGAAMAVSGCAVFGGSTIDGFTPGVIEKCAGPTDPADALLDASCPGQYRLARAVLDARNPGHAAVMSLEMYSDGTQPGPIDFTGPGIPPSPAPRHPGPNVTVFVYKLADGSTRATGVACMDDATGRSSCVGVASYPN
jgi:hypothetical protein